MARQMDHHPHHHRPCHRRRTLRLEQTEHLPVQLTPRPPPPVAKEWAEKIVDINEHMREQDVKEAGARIPYLEGKLQGTNIAGMQQVFYQLLESEPKRALIAIVATILGVFTVFVIAFIRSGKTSAREENK